MTKFLGIPGVVTVTGATRETSKKPAESSWLLPPTSKTSSAWPGMSCPPRSARTVQKASAARTRGTRQSSLPASRQQGFDVTAVVGTSPLLLIEIWACSFWLIASSTHGGDRDQGWVLGCPFEEHCLILESTQNRASGPRATMLGYSIVFTSGLAGRRPSNPAAGSPACGSSPPSRSDPSPRKARTSTREDCTC